LYFSLTVPTGTTTVDSQISNFQNSVSMLEGLYKTTTTTNKNVHMSTDLYSYWKNVDLSSTAGIYDTFVENYTKGEAALTPLASTGGYVDMYLYHYSAVDGTLQQNNPDNLYSGIIRLTADGTVVVTSTASAATVPIPPSVLLFGSGLLGLFGIRRKTA
jgi:hypothetical protein